MLTIKNVFSAAMAVVFCFCISFTGCAESDPNAPKTGRKKTMVIQLDDDPSGLNPATDRGAVAAAMQNLIFDHLIVLDFETFDLRPSLAKRMPDISEDQTRMTFELREDAVFSDGHPVTSEDILFTFKAIANPYVSASARRSELLHFEEVQIIDDRNFVLGLSDAGPFDLSRLAVNFFVLPKHIYDPNDFTDKYSLLEARVAAVYSTKVSEDLARRLRIFAEFFEGEKFQRGKDFVVGSGPYKFDDWQTDSYVRLVKNENYWNEETDLPQTAQNMDTLTYKIIPEAATTLLALRSGEIDLSANFTPDQFQNKMEGEDFDAHFAKQQVPYPVYEYIGYNTRIRNQPRKVFFQDPNVRRALGHLIDVPGLIENVMNGTARPITALIYPDRPEYNNELSPLDYNTELGEGLLEAAGWTDHDGDGIRDKKVLNSTVKFEFTLYYRRGSDTRKRIARHVREQLKKHGIIVQVQEQDWNNMLDRLKKNELDAWISGWAYDSDEQDLYSLFHSGQTQSGGYNWTTYNNPEADSLMEAIILEWDTEKRYNLHRKLQSVIHADQPYTMLFLNSARIGYNKRLKPGGWYAQRPCYQPGEFTLSTQPQ